jgi:hypothetical protein
MQIFSIFVSFLFVSVTLFVNFNYTVILRLINSLYTQSFILFLYTSAVDCALGPCILGFVYVILVCNNIQFIYCIYITVHNYYAPCTVWCMYVQYNLLHVHIV